MSTLVANRVPQWAGGSAPPPNGVAGNFGEGGDPSLRLLRRCRLGLGLWVCSIVMLFVGLSSAYLVRRGIPTYDSASGAYSTTWEALRLPVVLLFANTLMLIAASAAIEAARRTIRDSRCEVPKGKERHLRIWNLLSLALLALFLAGQAFAWQQVRSLGQVLTSGARAGFFYVLTGTHAVHAIIGLILVAWIALPGPIWESPYRRYIATDITAWYLHAMTGLWIYLFVFLLMG